MSYLTRCISATASLCLVCLFAGCSDAGITTPTTTTTPPVPTITAKAKFAYTGNQGASLSGYSVNTSTGVLTPLSGFPLVAGLNPTVVTHDPQNRFLIVGDIAANMLHILAINSTTGALTEVNPSPYTTVKEPVSLIVDPAGTHVYVASQGSNQVGAYSLSSTGVLTAISGSPFASGGTQNFGDSLTVNAAGTFLYLQDTVNIYAFGINATSGALTLLQTVTGPVQGGGLALDPAGTYLYAVGSGTDSILTYSINATSGLLTLTKSSAMLELNGAYTIAVSPTGQFTYTAVAHERAFSNGAFTPEGAPYSGVYGQQIGIDPSGSFVYAPQACSNCPSGVYNVVNEFSIGATGALTKLSGSPVAAGTTPWGITITTQ